jgi:hypothetical protein
MILRFKGAWRAVVLAERIADGAVVSDEASRLRRELPERAFLWIDGFRQEKENNIMWRVALAAAACLSDTAEDRSTADRHDLWRMPGPSLIEAPSSAAAAVGHLARRTDREQL